MADSLPFDRIADRYDATRGGERRGRAFAEVIAPWLAPGRTLEIGVGTGLVAHALRRLGLDVYGVDLAPAMLSRAYARVGARVALGDARHLPVRTGVVDNALLVAAVHAIRDTPAALREAARVVRPGGRVVVLAATASDPTDDDIAPVLAGLPHDDRPDRPAMIADAATAAGLVVTESRELAIGAVEASPNLLADHIEQRIWSQLWHVDGAVWGHTVQPVIDRLRALPDPDEPRERPHYGHLSVFARP
jgi:SAM-dependent methyltransferase